MRPRSLAIALVWLTVSLVVGISEDKDASVKELASTDVSDQVRLEPSDQVLVKQDGCMSEMHALGKRVGKMQELIGVLEKKIGSAKVRKMLTADAKRARDIHFENFMKRNKDSASVTAEDVRSKPTRDLITSLKSHIHDANSLRVAISKLPKNEEERKVLDERKEKEELYHVHQIFQKLNNKAPKDKMANSHWKEFKQRYLQSKASLPDLEQEEKDLPAAVRNARDKQFAKAFFGPVESPKMLDHKILQKKTATLEKRLSDLKQIEESLHSRKEEMRKRMEEFMSDGPSVRLKLGMEKLKDQTSKDAWNAYRKRQQIAELMKPRPANAEEKGLALQSLKDFSKSGSINDLKVQVTKEIPDINTMNKLQTQFQAQLKTFSADFEEKLKITDRNYHKQKADAIHWQAQSKQCQAKLGAAKALNLQLGQRYHKHKSLEVNAKWEFKEFRKRHKEGTVLHKQFVLQGLKPNWLRSKEEDTGRFKRPNPAAVSAELVALKGAEAAAEIENPANKPNVTNVNNDASNTTEALPEISPLHLDLGEVNSNSSNSTNPSNSDDEDGNEDGGDESLRPDDTDENDDGVDFGTSLELIQTATTRKPLRQQATLSLQSMLDAELNSMPDLQQSANEIYSQDERFNDFIADATKHLNLNKEQLKGLQNLAKRYSNGS